MRIAGAYVLFGFSEKTSLARVERVLRRELPTDVRWHLGRTMGYIQLVLRQDDGQQDIAGLAAILSAKLLQGQSSLHPTDIGGFQ